MRRIISILLENESGALSRVVGLFSQRGYNIESLTVAPTDDSTLSRMTIQTIGNKKTLEQIIKNLHKLVDVLHVKELEKNTCIFYEIMLIKIKFNPTNRTQILENIKIFSGKIVDITSVIYIVRLIGSSNKLDSFINIINNISESIKVVRSGILGISSVNENIR